uniref:CobN/Magnesium Chelatase n=1 Tax=Candidatus Kentrum sp. FW TaxID=2126338 RepID=A0A450TXF9_9GAMM|nr:MAG: CobN/Magnesium Chelatase [Candidatus Kentron sp. FW]
MLGRFSPVSSFSPRTYETEANVEPRFAQFLVELHDYMHDLVSENQPLGLHTWGELPEDRLFAATVMQILGNPYAEAAAKYLGGEGNEHGHDHGQ